LSGEAGEGLIKPVGAALTGYFYSLMIASMKILSAAQMGEVDRLTSEGYGLPGILLMENAAATVCAAAERRYGNLRGKRALVICGKGNNGGDGAAIARQLQLRGSRVRTLLLGKVEDSKGDARRNFEILRALAAESEGCEFFEIEQEGQLLSEAGAEAYDLFFDAIFGTGLKRKAEGLYEQAILFLNRRGPVVAVDIPSGLSADLAEPLGANVRAELTVTFTAPKIANLFAPAAADNGELVIAPIGSPASLVEACGAKLNLVEAALVAGWLAASRRSSRAHKGDAGKLLIIAGSRGKSGAAALAGEAAMRAGAGLVTIATAQSAQPAVAAQVIAECMSEALAETENGTVGFAALERAQALAGERDLVAIGPGLGSAEESTRNFVRQLILRREWPMVIDADGLNALVGWTEKLQGSPEHPLILTPHSGEMARLLGKTAAEVNQNRLAVAGEFAAKHRVILVLKGQRSLIAAPDGEIYVNPTGNAGMATGGSGDVLTGIIAGLLAQKKNDALGATIAGVYLHGLAGDLAASQMGMRAMIASDITSHLGEAFLKIGGDAERPEKGVQES
jgi:ADP-dependent NAD(P)H-hydrate dehydratase / NAD(P)H-hydrate epimerase